MQWHGSVFGLVSLPRPGINADRCGALGLGESVILPDGRDERCRRAGVDLGGGEDCHAYSPMVILFWLVVLVWVFYTKQLSSFSHYSESGPD